MHASKKYYTARNKSTLEDTAATSRGSNPPPPNLIASHEPSIQKQSYHPWIRARNDVSYHHFRLHFFALYLIRGRTGRWEGGKTKKKKKRSQPVQAQHQPTPALGHPASQSGGFKKYYQTRQASSLSLNLSGTNSTR